MTNIEILSPHLDDAVLGAWHLLDQPEVDVLTVFAGIPDANHKAAWDRWCGEANSIKMMHLRLAENEAALTGTQATITNLPILQGQYHPAPLTPEEIAEQVLETAGDKAVFYAPTAALWPLRRHEEHAAVREAAKVLLQNGQQVRFYADLPYTMPFLNPKRWTQRLKQKKIEKYLGLAVDMKVYELTPKQQKSKQAAVKKYSSQYRMLNIFAMGALNKPDTYKWEVEFIPR